MCFNPFLLPGPAHCDGAGVTPLSVLSVVTFLQPGGRLCHLGELAERSQGQRSALSARPASGYFCTCRACAAAKAGSVCFCLAARGEGCLGNGDSVQGGSRAPCLSCSQCPEQPVQVLSPHCTLWVAAPAVL